MKTKGFFSLAQANFNHPHRSRYGQDYYDERMQAQRRVEIEPSSSDKSLRIHKFGSAFTTSQPTSPTSEPKDSSTAYPSQPPSHSLASTPSMDSPSESLESPASSIPDEKLPPSPTRLPPDPIRMFGILVPPALRAAQASFSAGVDESLGELASLTVQMRRLEGEIARSRKGIKRAERAAVDGQDGKTGSEGDRVLLEGLRELKVEG
ncbi:hypothetical protein BDY21DRAFT_160257 [Lineolata rhizophorae]|uniref:Vacuolar ATPase assembly protein VMA22 n=1 Tax=Lineolata rhizophorae TaxID=578093 RepID=A0A6A6P8M1_9PEZI|nr:hypothetical protein BDY21DRAFT_160257 [Lineolata rhizophorae]